MTLVSDESQPDKLDQITQSASHQMQETADLETRLAAFEKRTKIAKSKFESTQAKPDNSSYGGSSSQDSKGLGVGLSIAYGMIGVPILLYFLGRYIDSRVGGETWQAILGVSGAVLGFVWVIVVLQRHKS